MPALQCPECDARYVVPEQILGKKVKCKKCGGVFQSQAPQLAHAEFPVDPNRLDDLLDEVGSTSPNSKASRSAGGATRRCPHCNSNLESAVICITCGYNVMTGRQLTTSVESFKRHWHLGFLPLAGLGCFYTLTLRKAPGQAATLVKTRRIFFLPVRNSQFSLDNRKSLAIGYGSRISREFWWLMLIMFGCGIIPGLIFLPLWLRALNKEDVFVLDLVETGGRRTNLFRGPQEEIMRDLADTLSEMGQLRVERA